MKIGIYFDSRHIGQWTWDKFLAGDIGLSGTDSQILHLAYDLVKLGYNIYFFATQLSTDLQQLNNVQVADLNTAVVEAKNYNLDLLIFNNRENEATKVGINQCETVNQLCIVWCQNDPSSAMADLLSTAKSVRRVICVSAIQADGIRDHPVFKKVDYVHNAIDINLFDSVASASRNTLGVCYLGSLTTDKGFQHLVKAWSKVHQVIPDATLTVLGSAKLYDRNSSLGSLGIADREFELTYIVPYLGDSIEQARSKGVEFLGLVSPKTIRSVIASSSVGVVNPNCSTSYETFCVSAVEIQAAGAAVVGGNIGGLKETVCNRKTGILINSEQELDRVLIKLLTNPKIVELMGINGQQWVQEKFNRDIIIERWDELLKAVVRGDEPKSLKFNWKQTNLKGLARRTIQQARKIPILRNRLPTLYHIKRQLTKT
jgi:glycosyltransferase involved in cell wall biosynthesis